MTSGPAINKNRPLPLYKFWGWGRGMNLTPTSPPPHTHTRFHFTLHGTLGKFEDCHWVPGSKLTSPFPNPTCPPRSGELYLPRGCVLSHIRAAVPGEVWRQQGHRVHVPRRHGPEGDRWFHQDPGRKQMTHPNGVISGEFDKVTIARLCPGGNPRNDTVPWD